MVQHPPIDIEFILPEKWKVAVKGNLEFFNDLGRKLSTMGYHGYITSDPYDSNLWKFPSWGLWMDVDSAKMYTEITLDQFKKYVLKMDSMQKIIGYKLKDDCKQYEYAAVSLIAPKTIYPDATTFAEMGGAFIDGFYTGTLCEEILTKAGVIDLWFEPVYEQNHFKVGDWVYWSGNRPTFAKINSEIDQTNCYKLDVNGDTTSYSSCHKSNLRKATTEEIQNHLVNLAKEKGFAKEVKFTVVRVVQIEDNYGDIITNCSELDSKGKVGSTWEYNFETDTLLTSGFGLYVVYEQGKWATIKPPQKIVSVGGKFDVTIKDDKIWHRNDDITEFVKQLVEKHSNTEGSYGGYPVTFADIVFSQTGRQKVETKLSDWIGVLDEYNKFKF